MKAITCAAGMVAFGLIATPVAATSVSVSARALQPIATSGELKFTKTVPRLEADLFHVRPQLRADVGAFVEAHMFVNDERN
jgi:hypothetical protein